MTKKSAQWLPTGVIAVRATSLIFTKFCLREMGTFNLLFLRFLTAFILLAIVFCRRLLHIKRSPLWRGMVLGVLFFAIMSCEVTAATTGALILHEKMTAWDIVGILLVLGSLLLPHLLTDKVNEKIRSAET